MTENELPAWFREATIGLFVHWGLSSVHGGVDLSWGMIEDKPWGSEDDSIPPAEYYALAKEFDPDAFDPDRWLRAAREAGMEYATLTARHHDGFALWPSEYGEFSTATHGDGRDFVGEFVDACRRQGLRVGLYYSPRDWTHPAYPDAPGPYEDLGAGEPETTTAETAAPGNDRVPVPSSDSIADFEAYFSYVHGQLEELLTRYGRIDQLWFDGFLPEGSPIARGAGELHDLVRSAQPDIVVNDRCGSPRLGDYNTPEGAAPDRPMDRPWERAEPWAGGGWAFTEGADYPDLETTLELIARTASRGGNLLLSVGPDAEGRLPDVAYDRLGELADWMDHGGPAVRDVDAGPWPERADVPITRSRDGRTWYLHVLAKHEGPVTVQHVPEPRSVRLLRTGEPLDATHDAADLELTVRVPADRRTNPDTVAVVTWAHPEPFEKHGSGYLQTVPE